jgi:hypothetical protein
MKRFLKWAGYMLLSFSILFLLLLLYREPVGYYVLKNVASYYAGRVETALDIGSIGGTLFSETTLDAVYIRPEKDSPQAYHFKAQSITCTYNLWDLKEGYELFLKGLHCSAADPEFSYDFRLAAPQDQLGGGSAQFLVPAVLPELDLQNGTVILTHAGWLAEMRGINSGFRSAGVGAHELHLQAENFRFNQDGVTRIDTGFTSLLRYDAEKLSIDSLELGKQEISAAGYIDLARIDKGVTGFVADLAFGQSRLNMAGSLENRLLKFHVRTDSFDSAELQKRLGGSGWDISGKIRGEADLAYNLELQEGLHGSFALEVQEGQLHGVGIEAFSLAGSFDDAIFNISSAEARTPGNHILVSDVSVPVSLLLKGEALPIMAASRAKFAVDAADFGVFLKLAKVEDNIIPEVVRPDSLTIHGSLENGAIYIAEAIAVAPGSRLAIDQAIVPIPSTVKAFESVPVKLTARLESREVQGLTGLFSDIAVSGEAAADLRIAGSIKELQGKIIFTGENLGYRDLRLGSMALQGEVELIQDKPGTIRSAHFTVTGLTQANDSGTLALVSPIEGTWQPERFSMGGVVQIDGQGEVAISVAKSRGRETTVEIRASNLDSDGWLGNFMDNRYFFHGADFAAVLTGFPENRQMQLTGSIEKAGEAGTAFPLTGRFNLKYSTRGIEISEFSWKSHGKNELTLSGFLPYDPLAPEPFLDAELALDGHIDFPALEDIAVFLEPLGISKGSVALDMVLSGSWQQPLGHVLLQAKGIEPPDMMLEYTDAPMDLSCDLAAEKGSIILNSAALESSDYAVQATGSWQHGLTVTELLQRNRAELGGSIRADAEGELKNLNFLKKKFPWLRRFDGDTQVKLHITGPASDPAITGSFSLKDGEVSHTFNLPMLAEVNLQGEFDGHSISITGMQAEVGGSPVALDGRISRMQEGVDVDLRLEGKNVLLLRNNDMRLRGDVQLKLSGPLEHLAISGTTALTGGYYTRNIDFLGKIGTTTAPVSSGGTFLFSFQEQPLKNAVFNIRITTVEPFRIRNNLIRGTLRPELSLKGTGELPFLVGAVYIDSSRVLLPSGRLQVQSGLVRFLDNDPDRPQLDLLANSKVQGYDINVVIQGPLDDPVITLSSSPALPNDDLLLLLLTGQLPQGEAVSGTSGLGKGATNVIVYLGRDFLNKWLEDESTASDETILDRFELDYGRAVTKSGEQTIESTFRLSEKATREKRVYYLSGEKDKYDAYNYGLKVVFRFE